MTDAPKGAPKASPKQQIKVIPPKTIVRKLTVGQEVTGRVRRLADFGAFIDIGVGTDGLVHVSEVSQKRINKPGDVLKLGQEVTAWIKELDRDRDRISLTLIPPDTKTMRDLQDGDIVTGKVTRIENYGIFVDLGVGSDGMVHVKEMSHGFLRHPGDMVKVGDEIQAQVIAVKRRRQQIDLSMRALMEAPEPEAKVEMTPAGPVESDPAGPSEEELEEPAPTTFEFALQRAQGNSSRKDRKRRSKKAWYDEVDDDDVVARTLYLGRD